jgi:3-oxosteroid 1-dehydrogenase
MWFPCNPVLRRAGCDDTLDAAFAYFHASVGDRTPVELQRAYVYGGTELIAYLEQDAHFEFDVLPWPDYYGRLPHARLDGLRHTVMKPLAAERLGELARRVRGPLDRERLGAEVPKTLIGGRALVGRFLAALTMYPHASLHLNCPLVELVTSNDGVVGAVVEQDGRRRAIRAASVCCSRQADSRTIPRCANASAWPAMRGTPWARRAIADSRSRQPWPQAPRPI